MTDDTPARTPQAFARLVASMSIEGECEEHKHPLEGCASGDDEYTHTDGSGPCTDGCEAYEPSGNDGEIDTLYNLIASARQLLKGAEA